MPNTYSICCQVKYDSHKLVPCILPRGDDDVQPYLHIATLHLMDAHWKVGNREKRGEGSAWSLCSGLPLSTAENRRAGVPKRANHALLSSLFSLLSAKKYSWSIRVHSWFSPLLPTPYSPFRGFLLSYSGDARRNRRAGAPKRANHALLSPLFSLLSTSCKKSNMDYLLSDFRSGSYRDSSSHRQGG